MSSRGKWSPDISCNEVREYIIAQARECGYLCDLRIVFPLTGTVEAYVEAELREVGLDGATVPVVVVRHAFPHKSASRQWSAALHAAASAYAELERNAWLWSAQARRMARGE